MKDEVLMRLGGKCLYKSKKCSCIKYKKHADLYATADRKLMMMIFFYLYIYYS